MNKPATVLLLSFCGLAFAAEPARDKPQSEETPALEEKPQAQDKSQVEQITADEMSKAEFLELMSQYAAAQGLRPQFPYGNCYFIRLLQPVPDADGVERPDEGPSDKPRFIPLQSPSQARVRPLVSTQVCASPGKLLQAVR